MNSTIETEGLDAALARHRQGDVHTALAAYQRLLARERDNPTLLRYFGLARFQLGAHEQGLAALERATRLAPADAAAWSDLGRMCAVLDRMEQAVDCFGQAVAADPEYADGWHNLGIALRRCGDAPGALEAYRRALALDPARAETYLNLGNLLVDDGQTDNAVESFKRAAQLDAKLAQARASLATELSGRGDVGEAEFVYRQAIALNPEHVQAWYGLGRTLEDLGRAHDAAQCYRRVLALRPGQPWALGQLLGLAGVAADDLAPVARRAMAAQETPDEAKAMIGYGLGKACERGGDYDAAFAAYAGANRARRAQAGGLDRAAFERRIDNLIVTFDEAFFASRRRYGIGTDLPVFIVGMPRSGTSLTEQILDSHPRALGAGELPHLAELAAGLQWQFGLDRPWPLSAPALTDMHVHELAHAYLDKLRAKAPAAVLRASDKSPLNFFHLGLVALLFPQARIVHCRRDPIDSCWSIFGESFRSNQTYATDLDDLAVYYRGYERLMAHWRAVLPLPMLELPYEAVVADIEAQARKLVAFMGLPWDERCLDFHRSRRAVQTPSRWQVRKPVYSSSVGRWRRYDRHLATLKAAFPEAAGPSRSR